MPPPPRILDSHIHLWPHSSTNPAGHAWMAPDGPLTRQFSLSDYLAASSSSTTSSTPAPSRVLGAVYIETDRTLTPSPSILTRAAQPLAELRWLRRLVTGSPLPGEGFAGAGGDGDGASLLWGVVPWLPVDGTVGEMREYVRAAEEAAGPEAWARVVGWRFLLQGRRDEGALGEVLGGEGWVEGVREVLVRGGKGGKGWCFDVGVDAGGAGAWQVERGVEACERVNEGVGEGEEGVRFVLNHLCKPDMQQHPTTPAQLDAFARWAAAIRRAGRSPHTYMKLSGAFSEMGPDSASLWTDPERVLARMRPWLDVLFDAFPPERIMFGSDWPVCNVQGGGDSAWRCWVNAVERILDAYGLTEEQRDRVWYGTAVEAYRLTPPGEKA
ncbi:amidohydrolase family protein [Diplodia corticola]|uniref:Amidohydrolase family protein n=1 Tax=Diplodia corticola TaxID=236234 RepID=A0A1J9S4M8_9PEZI|nr:amidohydrolase family protein [Diplodia corticola]OJD35487.1 amidohydrolase family protein [Diplodia corticola]